MPIPEHVFRDVRARIEVLLTLLGLA